MGPRDQFDIWNDTDDPLPAGGLCQWAGGVTDAGAVKVVKPTAASAANLIVCGPHGIAPRSAGLGTFAPAVVVAFDPTAGAPAVGDTLGSQVGSWLAKKGNTGFVCYAGASGPWAMCVRVGAGTAIQYAAAEFGPLSYSITTDNVWQDIGLSIDLPAAGTYAVWAQASAFLRVTSLGGGFGAEIDIRLEPDNPDARISSPLWPAAIAAQTTTVNEYAYGSASVFTVVEVDQPVTVKLQAKRSPDGGSGPTWSHSGISATVTLPVNESTTQMGYFQTSGGGPRGEPGAAGPEGPPGADGATNPEAGSVVIGLQVFGP